MNLGSAVHDILWCMVNRTYKWIHSLFLLAAFWFSSCLQTIDIRIYTLHVITYIPPSLDDVTDCLQTGQNKQNCVFFCSFDLGIPVSDRHQNAGCCRHGCSCVLRLLGKDMLWIRSEGGRNSFTPQHTPWRQGTKTSLAKPVDPPHHHHRPYCVESNQRSMKLMSLDRADFKAICLRTACSNLRIIKSLTGLWRDRD
jgi:hypothetical protein